MRRYGDPALPAGARRCPNASRRRRVLTRRLAQIGLVARAEGPASAEPARSPASAGRRSRAICGAGTVSRGRRGADRGRARLREKNRLDELEIEAEAARDAAVRPREADGGARSRRRAKPPSRPARARQARA